VSQVEQAPSITLRDYARVIWLGKWLVLAAGALGALLGFGLAIFQQPLYEATATLMYQPPADISNPTQGAASIDINTVNAELQSVINMIDTPAVGELAGETLDEADKSLDSTISAKAVLPQDATGGTAIAELVAVTAETTDAEAAARLANAFAQAVIDLRKKTQQQRYRAAQKVVEAQMKLFNTPASRLTTDYAILSQQLRNLQIAEATATGDFEVIIPATPPSSRSSPHPFRDGLLGLGIGLVLGIGLAFVVGQFDTRVRTHRQASSILNLPLVGRIPHVSHKILDSTPLIVAADPGAPASEALRMLRSSLAWASIDEDLCSLLITSSAKGEGKTVTACNLAVTLARGGHRVLIIDADLRDPRVHRVFNLPNAVGLTSVILGTTRLEEATRTFATASPGQSRSPLAPRPGNASVDQAAGNGALRVLTSGPLPPDPGEVIASRKFANWLRAVCRLDLDYVIVDAPPLLSVGDSSALAPSVDALLMVVNLNVVRRPILTDARESLEQLPCRKIGMVTVGERFDGGEYYRYGKRS